MVVEDILGDHLMAKPVGVVLTADMLTVHPAAAKLHRLIALSEGFSTNDTTFARQVAAIAFSVRCTAPLIGKISVPVAAGET
eukprot:SAG31_NODE_646_length_13223_cov_14.088845_5_plen_82_part_00